MSDEIQQAEDKLRRLGRRVRSGLARLHPPTEQQMAKVREALRQQWEQTQKQGPRQRQAKAAIASQKRRQELAKQAQKIKLQSRTKTESKDHSQSQ